MIQVKCDVQTRKAIPNSNLLGFETDNESNSIYFRVNPHISGTAEVYIERDQDTGYIVLDEASDSYYLPIKKSLVKQKGTVIMQLIITTSDEKVYTFDKITFEVKTSIKVDEEIPDEYPTWMEVGNARLAEFNEAIEETNVAIQEINEAIDDANQAIDDMNEVKDQILEDKEAGLFDGFSPIATVTETQSGATISITDVNGTTTADVLNGEKGDKGDTGASAKINGVNTLTIEAGENVTLNQEDSTLTISATDTTDYTELTNKPSVNNVELNGNKTLAELGIKQTYTKSDVGLNNVDNIRQYSADNPPPYPVTSINSLTGNVIIDTHDDLIPTQASSSNQLADKNFVNSSIATSTATFKGTYDSLAELEAVTADDNDYGFVVSVDSSGNTVYNRYKYSNNAWVFEYALNNSSFTQAQWAAIQSGITSDLVTKLQGIEEGAEVNVIEGVEIANTLQSITGKIVKIEPDTTPVEDSTNVINSNAVYEIENMLPIDTTTGDIDNAQPYKVMSVSADGKYQQESTTGKQLFDNTQAQLTSSSGTKTTVLPTGVRAEVLSTGNNRYGALKLPNSDDLLGKTLTLSATISASASNTANIRFYWLNNTAIGSQISGNLSQTGSVNISIPSSYPNNANGIAILFSSNSGGDAAVGDYVDYTNVLLRLSSITDDTYEPYTNGASPNPNYPQTITQVTSATWNRTGKNLCNIINPTTTTFTNGLPYNETSIIVVDSFNSNNITFHSTSDKYVIVLTNIIQLKPNTQYTIKFNRTSTATNNQWFIYDYDNGIYSINYRDNNTNILEKTFTTNILGQIALAFGYGNVTGSTTVSNIQLEEGSTVTLYEPYQGQSIPIDLDGNEVCATDTIKDKLLVDRYGNVAIQKNVGKVVLNGSEDWEQNDGATLTNSIYFSSTVIDNTKSENTNGISNYFTVVTTGLWNTDIEGIQLTNSERNIRVRIGKDKATGIGSFKTWLSTHNTIIYYELATPTIIPLPKLSILPSTLKGINHTWVDTNLGTTDIEVEYVEDLSMAIPTSVADLTDGANYVKNTDYASTTTGGVIVVSSAHGTSMSNDGKLRGVTKTYAQYQSADNLLIVSKITLENVLTERIGTIETALTTLDVGGGVQ